MTETAAAEKIGCTLKALPSWLRALGMFVTCTRCHGSGKFSYNQIHGDRCYGCSGRGTMMPALTAKVVAEAAAKVAAGEMVPHLAKWRAQNAAKKAIAPLVAEGRAIYETIGNEYSAAYDARSISDALMVAQSLNNDLFWGHQANAKADGSLMGIERAVKFGDCTDYVEAAKQARRLVAALRGLRVAYAAYMAPEQAVAA